MPNKILKFIKKHWIFWCFLAYSVLCWSWLLEIDLAQLASSSFAGKIMQTIVLVSITLLSAVVYTKSLKYILATLRKGTNWATPLKLIIWWAATEMFVAWVVCIIWYGKGGSIDNILPFTSLSHLAIWTPLGYLSRFVGFYGLSGVVFMLVMLSIRSELRKYLKHTISAVVVLTLFAWVAYRIPSGPSINTVVVSERNQSDKLYDSISVKGGSLVIFPETSLTGIEESFIQSKVKPRQANEVVYYVGSRFVYEQKMLKNQLVGGDTSSGIAYKFNKSRLIPGGEYLPYATIALFKMVGANDVLEKFRATRQISKAPGTPKQALLSFGAIKIGAGICSSIIAPEDYRKLVRGGANILTNSARLGVFSDSKIYGWYHQSMAKFMAVANNRAFLQSANGAAAFGFNGSGAKLFQKEDTGITELPVSLNSRRTAYSFLGEYLGVSGLAWVLLDIYKSRRKV